MIPPTLFARRSAACIPRESGDDPPDDETCGADEPYSPRERG